MNVDSRKLLIAPMWWDRRALERVDEVSDLDWIDTTSLLDCDSLEQASNKLAISLRSLTNLDQRWLLIYGTAAPLAIEALRAIKKSAPTAVLPRLLLISAARCQANMHGDIQKIQLVYRFSRSLARRRFTKLVNRTIHDELNDREQQLVESMVHEAGAASLQRTCDWMMQWKANRASFDELKLSAHQFHGRNDMLFQPPRWKTQLCWATQDTYCGLATPQASGIGLMQSPDEYVAAIYE